MSPNNRWCGGVISLKTIISYIILVTVTFVEAQSKLNLIVLTDDEPKSQTALQKLLLFKDDFNILGLIYTNSGTNATPNTNWMNSVAAPFSTVIKNGVLSGKELAGLDENKPNEGADFIVAQVDAATSEVYFSIFGSSNTLAQALLRAKKNKTPAQFLNFCRKIIAYENEPQEVGGWEKDVHSCRWIIEHFPNVTMVLNHYSNSELEKNNIEIQTCTFLNFINNGMRSHVNPTYGGWGGFYLPYPNNYYLDLANWVHNADGSWTCTDLIPYIPLIKKEFAARTSATANAIVVNTTNPGESKVAPGSTVNLDASASTGNSLSFKWTHLKGVGLNPCSATIPILNSTSSKASFIVPNEVGKMFHILCEVSNGNIVRYKRLVFTISNTASSNKDTVPPAAPANIKIRNILATSAEIYFDEVIDSGSSVARYMIYVDDQNTPYIIADAYSSWMRIPNLKPKTSYTVWVKAQDFDGNYSAASQNVKFTTTDFDGVLIAKSTSTITIDGNLVDAEWQGAQTLGFGNLFKSGFSIGAADYTGYFKTKWDANNIYIGLDITDDVLFNSGSEPDNIEFAICAAVDKGGAFTKKNFHYGVLWDASRKLVNPDGGGSQNDFEAKSQKTAKGFTMEISLPWKKIGITPSENTVLGFDIGANDMDNPVFRDGQTQWWGSAFNFRVPSLWGQAKLVDKVDTSVIEYTQISRQIKTSGAHRLQALITSEYIEFEAPTSYSFLLLNWMGQKLLCGSGIAARIPIGESLTSTGTYLLMISTPNGTIKKPLLVGRY